MKDNKNCICITAMAHHRCEYYIEVNGQCDKPGPNAERDNDMENMWIEGMKADGLSYDDMLQVFAMAKIKLKAFKGI